MSVANLNTARDVVDAWPRERFAGDNTALATGLASTHRLRFVDAHRIVTDVRRAKGW